MQKLVQVCYITYITVDNCESDIEAIVEARRHMHEDLDMKIIEQDAFDYTVTETIE